MHMPLPPNRTPQRTPRTMRDNRPIEDEEMDSTVLRTIAVAVVVGLVLLALGLVILQTIMETFT